MSQQAVWLLPDSSKHHVHCISPILYIHQHTYIVTVSRPSAIHRWYSTSKSSAK